jgi:hypothetical protein
MRVTSMLAIKSLVRRSAGGYRYLRAGTDAQRQRPKAQDFRQTWKVGDGHIHTLPSPQAPPP